MNVSRNSVYAARRAVRALHILHTTVVGLGARFPYPLEDLRHDLAFTVSHNDLRHFTFQACHDGVEAVWSLLFHSAGCLLLEPDRLPAADLSKHSWRVVVYRTNTHPPHRYTKDLKLSWEPEPGVPFTERRLGRVLRLPKGKRYNEGLVISAEPGTAPGSAPGTVLGVPLTLLSRDAQNHDHRRLRSGLLGQRARLREGQWVAYTRLIRSLPPGGTSSSSGTRTPEAIAALVSQLPGPDLSPGALALSLPTGYSPTDGQSEGQGDGQSDGQEAR